MQSASFKPTRQRGPSCSTATSSPIARHARDAAHRAAHETQSGVSGTNCNGWRPEGLTLPGDRSGSQASILLPERRSGTCSSSHGPLPTARRNTMTQDCSPLIARFRHKLCPRGTEAHLSGALCPYGRHLAKQYGSVETPSSNCRRPPQCAGKPWTNDRARKLVDTT